MKKVLTALVVLLASLGLTLGVSAPARAHAGHAGHARYTITPFHPEPGDRARLVREWRLWKSQGLHRYDTNVRRGCFCVVRPPLVTVVKGHRVTSVHYRGSDQQAGGGHGYEVDQLFRLLRHAYATADKVTVHWSRRGVPRSIYVDQSRLIADEEFSLTITLKAHDPVACPLATTGRCPGPPTA